MANVAIKNYDVKVVRRSQAVAYQSFGWVRSKDPVPEGTKVKAKKEPLIVLKRKLEFGMNPKLVSYEKEYAKLEKKKYKNKPILGIISFVLIIALLLVAGIELYYGVSEGLSLSNLKGDYYYIEFSYPIIVNDTDTGTFTCWFAGFSFNKDGTIDQFYHNFGCDACLKEEGVTSRIIYYVKDGIPAENSEGLDGLKGIWSESEGKITIQFSKTLEDGRVEYIDALELVLSEVDGVKQVTDDDVVMTNDNVLPENKSSAYFEYNGVKYYVCTYCGKIFTDANMTVEATDITIADAPEGDLTGDDTADTTTASGGSVIDMVVGILDMVHDDYLSMVTTPIANMGITDTVGGMVGAPISYFLSADTIVGIIALILAIIFIVIFAKVCGMKKKRIAKMEKLQDIREEASEIVTAMRRNDTSLMGKTERKQYMWENIIANAIIRANASSNVQDDDDENYY